VADGYAVHLRPRLPVDCSFLSSGARHPTVTSALFVVSEKGYWAEACVEPLTTLETDGVDETSLDPNEVGEATAEKARATRADDD